MASSSSSSPLPPPTSPTSPTPPLSECVILQTRTHHIRIEADGRVYIHDKLYTSDSSFPPSLPATPSTAPSFTLITVHGNLTALSSHGQGDLYVRGAHSIGRIHSVTGDIEVVHTPSTPSPRIVSEMDASSSSPPSESVAVAPLIQGDVSTTSGTITIHGSVTGEVTSLGGTIVHRPCMCTCTCSKTRSTATTATTAIRTVCIASSSSSSSSSSP